MYGHDRKPVMIENRTARTLYPPKGLRWHGYIVAWLTIERSARAGAKLGRVRGISV
jgi:hypothetical protein